LERFELLSPMPRAEIVRVLSDETDRWWTFSGAKPFVASVRDDGFSLHVRQWYRNSFRTELRARLHDEAGGTRLSCSAGMHPFVIAFMVAWFGIVATVAGGILMTFAGTAGDGDTLQIASGFFFLALMGVFGFGLIKFGRWLARDELKRMLAFLGEVIDAESVA
jgi:hypothetical protein